MSRDVAKKEQKMKRLQRIAFIGNHLPRRCGIATFTHDLHRAVAETRPDLDTCVVAMNDPGRTYDYPGPVRIQLRDDVSYCPSEPKSCPERCDVTNHRALFEAGGYVGEGTEFSSHEP
jgi:hypothetical protein